MTVYIPKFQLPKEAHIGLVALKVADLKKMTRFYEEVIGLQVLQENSMEAILGVGDTSLLKLIKIQDPAPLARKTGLYHVAFLLPTRKDLGNTLLHYLQIEAPLVGASDHGYSEALYLNDPEGNGIEVFWDKPMSQWDIREDGEIVGITEEMDAEAVIGEADRIWRGFPVGTLVGHVHLKVADLAKTEAFYTDGIGLSLKNNYGGKAKFFATGDYHHHLGSNIWMGEDIPAMGERDLGLAYFSFRLPSLEILDALAAHWQKNNRSYEKVTEDTLRIMDPNGIEIQFYAEK